MATAKYLDLLVTYYEEEIEGIAYFEALAEAAPDADSRTKLALLADVERRAAEVMEPLLARHDVTPRDRAELLHSGRAAAGAKAGMNWHGFVAYILEKFPDYLDDFARIESLAPAADLPALQALTRHEVDTIAFAERERDGDPDSTAPLRAYLAETAPAGRS